MEYKKVSKERYNELYKKIKGLDEKTGPLIKQIDRKNNTVTDYQYEFGKVSELEDKLPDITDYKRAEN